MSAAPPPPARPDRLRWPVLVACLVLAVGLGALYTRWAMALPDGVRACLADPAAHDGTRLVFPVWVVSGVDGPDRYRVSKVVKDVVVQGPTDGLAPGQTITLVGHFRAADSAVVELRREIHTLRAWKKNLSLLALGLALAAAPFVFRWRGGYLELRGLPPGGAGA